ncbi:hypothetical protein MmiHf6_15400 [Methanimicrococcus hongohii]|uniref:GIY-YIG domain-containing protein n=1 Tax=Methanimicrococcus hongohii TaxID=3028295 RepID=A0AA96V2L5_9EURY|nr:hypothetical protein [Methanimicrococcus sp. Hf6]WNY24210.1 hypothetical protein MmiHf6_15400 [Methanimicrococcus sp. Hf6]
MECFCRMKDADKIKTETFVWSGPFAWSGYENETGLDSIPDVEGVYLWTFEYEDGYLLYLAGVTKSMKTRFQSHSRTFKNGGYTVLDMGAAQKGIRIEIWHGWPSKENEKECKEAFNADTVNLEKLKNQLYSMRVFILESSDKRLRERMEAALMHSLVYSKESWADLADRGMALNGVRYNSEMPIIAKNIIENKDVKKIYGLFDE